MKNGQKSKIQWVVAVFAAILILLGSRSLYHFFEVCLQTQSSHYISPRILLDQFPYTIGSWEGVDVSISETVLKVAANDDYLSRLYVDSVRRLQATVYVAYTTEPRRMLGHRPRICYVGSGWVHDSTKELAFELSDGLKIPCLVHRFHKGGLDYQDIVVLNYYIVNGSVTSDHKKFSGLRWRRPRVSRGSIDYVAQVQISSVSEAALESLAREFTQDILRHFPEAP